jgi:pimeloyl-ACP methyl ester carboxylesterase
MASTESPRPASQPGTVPRPWTVAGPRDAPAIVFVHSTRLTRSQWLPQLGRLSGRYRCIALDLPGHGERAGEPFSMRAASDGVIAAIEAEVPSGRAVIVGLSLGGYVAIDAAERCPERVAGLVLAGCSAEPTGPVRALFRAFAWGLEHISPGTLRGASRGYFRLRYGRGVADPIVAGGFWPTGGAEALRELAASRFVERLARLWTPVLVVNGALDPVFGPGGDPWAAACRRGRHVVLARALHLVNLDRPRAFADLVAAFADDPAGAT